MPLLVGGFLELPLGVLAGQGRRRRLVILGGGIIFVLTLLAVASARSFTVLLCAFVAFYPASGAFVSLTQAEIMDAWPDRQARVMARWDLAGSTGAVAGPLLLAAVLASGGGWRAWLTWRWPRPRHSSGSARTCGGRRIPRRPRLRLTPTARLRSASRGRRGRGRSPPRCGTGGRCAGCC